MKREFHGVSLIEIMVGMTVLGLAMTLMVALVPSTAASLNMAEARSRAGALAQAELEALSLKDLSTLSDGPLTSVTLDDGLELRPNLKLTPAGQGAIRVRITVEWTVRGVKRSQFREKILFPFPR